MKGNKDEYTDCGMLIKLISDHMQSHANKLLNKINLTASQFRYLEYLNRNDGPVSFKDFEKHFQTSQPTVSGIERGNEENLILSALHKDEREAFHDMLARMNKKLSENDQNFAVRGKIQ